jgi:hypothetical protein
MDLKFFRSIEGKIKINQIRNKIFQEKVGIQKSVNRIKRETTMMVWTFREWTEEGYREGH